VVSSARETDLEAARAVWLRKFGAPPRDAAERGKQMRFLAGRGFPADVVRKVVGGGED
jgi:regulatory protein